MHSLLLWCALTALASSERIVHEKRDLQRSPADGVRRRVDPNAIFPVRIGLIQSNLDKGYDHLMSVSLPSSKNYGKHWTQEEVEAEFAPSSESVEAVRLWLEENGFIAEQTANKGWMAFDASAGQVEKLLDTQYFELDSSSRGALRVECDSYSLPEHIAPHVDYVTPGVRPSPPMVKTQTKRSIKQNPWLNTNEDLAARLIDERGVADADGDISRCGYNITPPCLRALYGIPVPPAKGAVKPGIMGIYEGDGQYAQSDLNLYFSHYAPYVPQGTHPYLVSINGAKGPGKPKYESQETMIDFDVAYSILGASNITLYEVAIPVNDTSPASYDATLDPFLDAIDGSYCSKSDLAHGFQCGTSSLTSVVSASYATPELFSAAYKYQQRVCSEFMKLSLQGHTIVFATGDYGVASNPGFGEDLCENNGCIPQNLNNTDYNAYNGTIFSPSFPANCPYVLAVGATMLYPGQRIGDPESAMNLRVGFASCDSHVTFGSSGGFANYFPRPSYQDSAVESWFANYTPKYKSYVANNVSVESSKTTIGKNGGIYNRAGRAYPDVSANGVHYAYYTQGKAGPVDGTSLAAPLWASLIALINEKRAGAGKPNVGFVNPVLYENPYVFYDIMNGTNPGCGTDGFKAVKGWDPVTGLGTPNYPALLELFMKM